MAISYPLDLPTTKFKRLTIRANSAVAQQRSPYTYKRQVYEFNGQMWIAEVTLPPLTREDAEAWNAFLLKLNGPYGTFLLGDPSATSPRGSAVGSPVINGASQVGQTISTRGWTASQTNILKAGDWIQVTNHLYKVLTDANSDGSGVASLDIWPRLRTSYADATAIVTSNTKGTFALVQSDNIIYTVDEAKNYNLFFTAAEHF